MKAIYMTLAAVAAMMTACTGKASTVEAVEQGAENLVETTAAVTDVTYPRGAGVINYTPDKYPAKIQPDAEMPVVIDFNATWCGPCKRFEPVFHAAAEKVTDAVFLSVDVDENPVAAEQFGVSSIPMVVVLMPDGTTRTQVGAMDAAQFAAFLGK